MGLVPKLECEQAPEVDFGDFKSVHLSRTPGIGLQPLFPPPDQPQLQDISSLPPPMAPFHQEGLSDLGFFSHEGFVALGCQGQSEGASSPHIDLQDPRVNRFGGRESLLMQMPFHSTATAVSQTNERGVQPDIASSQRANFDMNIQGATCLPGPCSTPSTLPNPNSYQLHNDPHFRTGKHGPMIGKHGQSSIATIQSTDVNISADPEPMFMSLPGPSSSANTTTSFNAWQHHETNLSQNPAHIQSHISSIQQSRSKLQQTSNLPRQRSNVMKEPAATYQRPSVIQSSIKGVRSSSDDQPPMTFDANQGIDIEGVMTMRFIQERFDSKENQILEDRESQRSSVIVNSTNPNQTTALLDFEGIGCEERDTELPEVNLDEINVKEYPDLKALCMTYLMEDAPNMKETEKTFYNAWYKINIGEQVLGSFIQFLKSQGPLPTTFMVMSGLQYR